MDSTSAKIVYLVQANALIQIAFGDFRYTKNVKWNQGYMADGKENKETIFTKINHKISKEDEVARYGK